MTSFLDGRRRQRVRSARVYKLAKILGICALISLAGCKRAQEKRFYVERLTLADATLAGNGSLQMSTDDLRQALVAALEKSKTFRPLEPGKKAPKGEPALRCKLELAFTRESQAEGEGAQGSVAEVGVVLEMSRPGSQEGGRFEVSGFGRTELNSEDAAARVPAFRKALAAALDHAVQSQQMQLAALDKPEPALIEDLKSTDVRARDFAVQALADRKSKAAVPALIERLKDPDREVVMRSVGALGAIRDPRAVPALIELTQNRDASFVLSVVEVVGEIGGPDAEAYLFTVASGHPDEAVRRAAEAAGARLKEPNPNSGQNASADSARSN